ncbi:MAG TPA: ATP-binding protein [Anaerolineae bacterium]|nr:ATP-binding protein [Anaerolineae bacterium]
MTDSTLPIPHSELDDFFGPRKWDQTPDESTARPLGIVVGGSLSKGLEVKLDRAASIEDTAVGRYVVIEGQARKFFSMITDVQLDATDPRLAKTAPDMSDDFIRDVMIGTSTFGLLHVSPMLVLEDGATEPKPVKTVPGHFARVVEATSDDVNKIFGDGGTPGYFHVGEPLDMDGIRIYLNLKRFVERSSGVFGKSGTGKTFLTRMLLAGIIKENVAVNLVFDMHNEYGWKSQDESKFEVKGLRQLFPSGKVAVVTLDPDSSRRRGSKVDFDVAIGYDQLEPEDVEMLQGLMGLSDVQVGALYSIRRKLGKHWIARLLDDAQGVPQEMQDMIDAGQIHEGTLGAIQRKLSMFQRFGFLRPVVQDNVIEKLLGYINQGTHVVLEFGRYGSSLEAYLLVANFLTRRIHHAYVERKEAAQGGGRDEPKPLVITIEEAHKFLDPVIASQTIFGTIARELLKYNVTLLIVDQRPIGIDPEVMSQIGTRVTCLLDDESDIRAVFSGVSGGAELRQVLARLDTQRQALILGHAVPMPVVIRTRDTTTSDYYAALGYTEGDDLQKKFERNKRALGRDGGGLD